MKHIKSILTLTVFAAVISFTTSCGGPKYADTDQIKSWIMMESITKDVADGINDGFITKLKQNSVAGINTEATIELLGAQDTYIVNPWVDLCENHMLKYFKPSRWEINRNDLISMYSPYYCNRLGDNITRLNEIANDALRHIEKHYETGEYDLDAYLEIYNSAILDIYMSEPQNQKEWHVVVNEWVDYIYEQADEYVTVKDWEYDDDSTTKSCTGYYITYEIGDGFYVLTSLIEEDNSTKFEIEILYSGDSMIDLEQTLSLYKD